jgi:threonine/homoserine/homoserine lactone efflux protein
MIETLFNNPVLAVAVVLVAIILGQVLKVSAKIFKWIILIGAAYLIVNFIGIA